MSSPISVPLFPKKIDSKTFLRSSTSTVCIESTIANPSDGQLVKGFETCFLIWFDFWLVDSQNLFGDYCMAARNWFRRWACDISKKKRNSKIWVLFKAYLLKWFVLFVVKECGTNWFFFFFSLTIRWRKFFQILIYWVYVWQALFVKHFMWLLVIMICGKTSIVNDLGARMFDLLLNPNWVYIHGKLSTLWKASARSYLFSMNSNIQL